MDEHLLTEILAVHADRLVDEADLSESYLAIFPESRETLEPLLKLAVEVHAALQPVAPDPEFRRELRQGLISAARRQLVLAPYTPGPLVHAEKWVAATGDRIGVAVPTQALSRLPLVFAAVGSILSLVGVMAFILRSRMVHKPRVATR